MKTQILAFILTVLFMGAGNSFFSEKSENSPTDTEWKIQIALLLDTSGSMDGLIDQAKSQLWLIVNELALAKYDNEQPTLEIALYEYGNDSNPSKKGYIRKVCDLTTDLDKISEELFALTTNGGEEYCGQVIEVATDELQWSDSRKDLKIIFIAGNEEFNQGKVLYTESCSETAKGGIVVNTIFCGDYEEGISLHWKDGAKLTNGEYMNIDQNQETAYIETPYDDEILGLNKNLNGTYIAFGTEGEEMQARQLKQDENAQTFGSSNSVTRSISKSKKKVYSNSNWDLVDATDEEDFDINEIKKEQLPEEMKTMNEKEKKEYIAIKSEERSAIQDSIKILDSKRKVFIAEEKRKLAENGEDNSLNGAMIKAIRKQAETKDYKFEE